MFRLGTARKGEDGMSSQEVDPQGSLEDHYGRKVSQDVQRRPGNQVPTKDGWRGSQSVISSSMPSWTNQDEGQGDDQGPTVRRSERSEDSRGRAHARLDGFLLRGSC